MIPKTLDAWIRSWGLGPKASESWRVPKMFDRVNVVVEVVESLREAETCRMKIPMVDVFQRLAVAFR